MLHERPRARNMSEHTKTDGLPDVMPSAVLEPVVLDKSRPRSERMASGKIECNACPVLCQISPGKTGACDRYANTDGVLVRVDPVLFLRRGAVAARAADDPLPLLPLDGSAPAEQAASGDEVFVTGVGASTTYPDYKPAPFIVASQARGVDMVTVVTEGIFSYCSFKVKIDTDRWLGPEQANIRCRGE